MSGEVAEGIVSFLASKPGRDVFDHCDGVPGDIASCPSLARRRIFPPVHRRAAHCMLELEERGDVHAQIHAHACGRYARAEFDVLPRSQLRSMPPNAGTEAFAIRSGAAGPSGMCNTALSGVLKRTSTLSGSSC